MRLHIAICDDEPAQIAYLCSLVSLWAGERHFVALEGFPSAEAFLFAYEDDSAFDILLLDIQMKRMDGMTLARQIRAANKEIQIIFITGYMEYMAGGYDVEALHYLLKPASENMLFAVLDRAADRVARNGRVFCVSQHGETLRLPLYEIRYLEVAKNYVTIHARDEFRLKKPLSELERELDESFFRVGRSFVVNLHFIRKVTRNDVILSDGTALPLPRGCYEALNRALIARL